jgi:hypothetical protein
MSRRITVLAIAIAGMVMASRDARADYLGYDADSTVKIFINWESFEDNGIPASWKGPFQDAVINCYTRWQQVAGMRLKPKFWGYTTKAEPESDEMIISMNEKHSTSTRLASRFGKPAKIVFHRKSGATGTDWNFVPYRAAAGEFDMQGILMHEMGHAFGLEHEPDATSVMFGSYRWQYRYGPYSKDIADMRAQYAHRTDIRLGVKRSTDGADTWGDHSSNLSGLAVSTTNDAAAIRDTDRTILFFTNPGKRPAFIHADNDGSDFDTSKWWFWGGWNSLYGMGAHGWNNEYMFTFVDGSDDLNHVRVAYSNDGGVGWVMRDPEGAPSSIGTPAVFKVSANTWVLAYAKLDTANRDNTGQIITRVSTDDGRTWGAETLLTDFYRSADGVSLAAEGTGEIRVGFSWADRTVGADYRMRTLRARLVDGALEYVGVMTQDVSSRTKPSMAKSNSAFVQSQREPNFNTSINTRKTTDTGTVWSDYVRVVETSLASPGLAAHKDLNFLFMYFLDR